MPAEFEKGFTVREPAWHGLAVVLQDYPGREEAMKVAGHNFQVVDRPALAAWDGQPQPIEGWKALFRDDSKKVIGVVRDSYTVVQNGTMWDIVDAIVKEPNVKYETAGILKAGAVLWVLARIDEPTQVPGDPSPILPYVMVSTSHDGTEGLTARAQSVRVVCWNTFQMARSETAQSGREFGFKHTKNVMVRIEEAREALGMVRHSHQEFMELALELADRTVTEDGVKEFLARFIPEPPVDVLTDRVKQNIADTRFQVYNLLDGPSIPPAHRRTSYGLWMAGIEYMDHLRKFHTPETYFRRTTFDYVPAKVKLAKLAAEVAT